MMKLSVTEIEDAKAVIQGGRSGLHILYSESNIATFELVEDLTNGHAYFYYYARLVSMPEQLSMLRGELSAQGCPIPDKASAEDILKAVGKIRKNGMILVVDDFEHLLTEDDALFRALFSIYQDPAASGSLKTILISHQAEWIEQDMMGILGDLAGTITSIQKINRATFADLQRSFPGLSFQDQVMTYAVLGGDTLFWHDFEDTLSFRENVCRTLLCKTHRLSGEPERLLRKYFREPGVYLTLLYEMGDGEVKLNDIYKATGFARAKIAVYLNNLIHAGIVEKVNSFDAAQQKNAAKGMYRICHPMMRFYVRFILPNLSGYRILSAEQFYDSFIAEGMPLFADACFVQIVRQKLLQQDRLGVLPVHLEMLGEWAGKTGHIDLVAQQDTGETLMCMTCFHRMLTKDDLAYVRSCAQEAGLHCDYLYLFARNGFDQALEMEARISGDRIRLIGSKELTEARWERTSL